MGGTYSDLILVKTRAMELNYIGGKVVVIAQTVEDIQRLVSEFGGKPKASYGSVSVAPKNKKKRKYAHGSTWKGKHRKACPICGKMKKSVALHIKLAHDGVRIGKAAAKDKREALAAAEALGAIA